MNVLETTHGQSSIDCGKCVCCKFFSRVRSWKTPSYAPWRSIQKSTKNTFRRVSQGVRSLQDRVRSWARETRRNPASFYNRSIAASQHFSISSRHFADKWSHFIFCIGTSMLTSGVVVLLSRMDQGFDSAFYISLMVILTGSLLIWIPVYIWMSEINQEPQVQVCDASVPAAVLMGKPPDYESLTPLDLPPAYEDVYHLNDYLQALLPSSHDQSISGHIGVSLCPVHQPGFSMRDTCATGRPGGKGREHKGERREQGVCV